MRGKRLRLGMTVVRRFATKASNANSAFAAHQKCFNRVQSLKKTGCQLKLMQLIRHMVEPVFLCRTGCLGGSFSTLLYLRQGGVSTLGAPGNDFFQATFGIVN